jgi:hypothetical protein
VEQSHREGQTHEQAEDRTDDHGGQQAPMRRLKLQRDVHVRRHGVRKAHCGVSMNKGYSHAKLAASNSPLAELPGGEYRVRLMLLARLSSPPS